MKNLFYVISIVALLFSACTKEETPTVSQVVTINATIGSDTRIALGEVDEKKVSWSEGDIINLTINEVAYPFIWLEGTTFAYTGDAQLPVLEEDMLIQATYAPTYSTNQTGLKADVGRYMALSAEKSVTSEQSYGELSLNFSHETSVLKLTLSNADFKGKEVTDIMVKAGATVIASASETFMGDAESGSVVAYLAVQPGAMNNVTLHATCDGNTYTNSLSNNTLVAGKIYKIEKSLPYSYVDLGLSVKWATCNVGANSAEEAGDYFAWGETEPKDIYSYASYKYMATQYLTSLTKYCFNSEYGNEGFTDDLTTLLPEDDAATANLGSCWRMPTMEEITELFNNCSSMWTTINGVNGYLLTSEVEGYTDKSIFLPAAGFKDIEGIAYNTNKYGSYWSNMLYTEFNNPSQAIMLSISETLITFNLNVRTNGVSVRPVYIGN